jgi:hypothetical protein
LFFDDPDLHLEEWIGKGYGILLSRDLNEELGAGVHGFARNLVKIIQHMHGVTVEPPTYAHVVFCTPHLSSSVNKCGVLHYSKILNSDHQGIYVDFDTCTLMG